ncbi:hypothetical protein NL676_002926 [Syzygium grande]|nr:hypothetical protein NL676_002926 [Syzygium grande]
MMSPRTLIVQGTIWHQFSCPPLPPLSLDEKKRKPEKIHPVLSLSPEFRENLQISPRSASVRPPARSPIAPPVVSCLFSVMGCVWTGSDSEALVEGRVWGWYRVVCGPVQARRG